MATAARMSRRSWTRIAAISWANLPRVEAEHAHGLSSARRRRAPGASRSLIAADDRVDPHGPVLAGARLCSYTEAEGAGPFCARQVHVDGPEGLVAGAVAELLKLHKGA